MLLMNVCGCAQRGVSTTNATMVGNADASASVMIAPDALQVKISICPGVSATMKRGGGSRGFSHSATTCSGNQDAAVSCLMCCQMRPGRGPSTGRGCLPQQLMAWGWDDYSHMATTCAGYWYFVLSCTMCSR